MADLGLSSAAQIVNPLELAIGESLSWSCEYKLEKNGQDKPALQLFARRTQHDRVADAPLDCAAAQATLRGLASDAKGNTAQWGQVRAAAVGVLVTELGLSGAAAFMESIEEAYTAQGWASRYEFSMDDGAPLLWWSAEGPRQKMQTPQA